MKKLMLLLLLGLSACATKPKLQSSEAEFSKTELLSSSVLLNVPFFQQEAGHCGPASLAMTIGALESAEPPDNPQSKVTLEQLTEQVFSPQAKGSFQADMIGAARRNGFLAVPVKDLEGILQEVHAGQPVLVFQNLAFTWAPQWHYAVVTGFELEKEVVLLHSGAQKNWAVDFEIFESSWALAGRWAYRILKPGQISETGGAKDHLLATLALEQIGKKDLALKSYAAIQKKWPEDLQAALAYANLLFEFNKIREADKVLSQTTKDHPRSYVLWNNLAVVQGKLGHKKKAQQSLAQAQALKAEMQTQ